MLNKYRMPLLEIASGLGGGLLVGALGAALGRVLGGGRVPLQGDVVNNFGDLISALIGFGLSYPLGVALGIALIRRNQRRAAAFGPALIAALVGTGLVLAATGILSRSVTPVILQILYIGVPPITALIGVRQWTQWTAARHSTQE